MKQRLSFLTVLKHCILALTSLAFAAPFLWVIVTSFKSPQEYYNGRIFPSGTWQFSNYAEAISQYDLLQFYRNSVIMAASAVVVGLILSLLAAYALFRLRFRFRNVVFVALVVLMMLPPQLTLIAQFLLFQKSHILYTPLALILPYILGVLPLGVFILRGFFNELPIDLDHAARMDGATDLQIIFLVLLPLSVPVLATACILTFIQTWNEFLLASIFVRDNWSTLPVAIARINTVATVEGNQPMKFAAVVLSFLPLLAVFLFMQRYFIKGLASGGLKG
ncbi:carbohydrate ABC transporter permease [Martelella soudanensis]|uniref:carbohydrate ABC transporter permease n=1 Tax=unclassified Martelella TaxID=2629616 RepID=UPI0015DF25CA|nr:MULTISPECIES: carbohydrate ABC transporter permease [unclassified Martelella]